MKRNETIEEEVQALLKELEEIPNAASHQMRQFAELWHEIGIKENNRGSRRRQIKDHIINLLGEMLEEEQNVKIQLENEIKVYREDLNKMSQQLKEEFSQVRI